MKFLNQAIIKLSLVSLLTLALVNCYSDTKCDDPCRGKPK